jgi:hypothetical protein
MCVCVCVRDAAVCVRMCVCVCLCVCMRAGVAKSHIRQHAAPGALRGTVGLTVWLLVIGEVQCAQPKAQLGGNTTLHTAYGVPPLPAVICMLLLSLMLLFSRGVPEGNLSSL